MIFPKGFDASKAAGCDYGVILAPLAEAVAAIVRYDQMLKGIHNSRLFLMPLQRQEAALSSSRMEGTISTLDRVRETIPFPRMLYRLRP